MTARAWVVAVVVAVATSGCAWTQWGGSAEHRGQSFVAGLSPATVGTWVSDPVTDVAASGPTMGAHGLGFVVAPGKLVAFDTRSNAIVWTATLPAGAGADGVAAVDERGATSTVFVPVAVGGSIQVVGFDVDGARHCNRNLSTCAPLFVAAVSGTALSPLTVHDGLLLVRGATTVAAFDATGRTDCARADDVAFCSPRWSAAADAGAGGIGTTATGTTVYDVSSAGTGSVLHARDEATGALRWTGTLRTPPTATPSIDGAGRVFVPAGTRIRVFTGSGCGAPTCAAAFNLAKATTGAPGTFRSTPTFDGDLVYETNANGTLSAWPAAGCGGSTCAPTFTVTVHTPTGGTGGYAQTPLVAGGVLFVLAQRGIAGTDHLEIDARHATNGTLVRSWDLGTGGFGAGLASVAMIDGVLYAPGAATLFAVHPKPVRPLASLALSPVGLNIAFRSSVFDYAVRCAAGTNVLTLTMSATPGGKVALVAPTTTAPSPSQSTPVSLTPNQAAVVRATDAAGAGADYWIRCLPPDFPPITVTEHPAAGAATPGYYHLDNPFSANGSQFEMILDTHGTPVWYRKVPASVNLEPVARNTIAFMPNPVPAGMGTDPDGRFDVYSLASNTVQSSIRTVGTPTDLHELLTLGNGHHMLLSYPLKSGVDLTGLPGDGPNSTIADCVVQELDPLGGLVWQWTGSDHLDPVHESELDRPVGVGSVNVHDVFHCNSIDVRPNGNVLVSARHLHAVFEIRRADGKVLWKLGGTPTNKDGAAILAIQGDPLGGPALQHDARYLPNGDISMFDNQISSPARGIEYAVDLATKTAHPVFSFSEAQGQPSCCMGMFRLEPDGHRVIGWGLVGANGHAVTELNAAGASVLDISLAAGNGSYRAIKVTPWSYDLDVLRASAGH